MKNKMLSYLLGGILGVLLGFGGFMGIIVNADDCNGIELNTNFPIIGNCIGVSGEDSLQAFPKMIKALTKIVMSLILVVCFIIIIVAGIMWASAGEDSSKQAKAKHLITNVAITILLLGFSGAILRLINPNFFK